MALQVQQTIPVLRMFDVEKTKAFYIDFLGFTVDWEHRFEPGLPLYMQISRAGCILHLSEHHGDGVPGVVVFVRVTGLKEFHAEIMAKGYKYARPGVEPTPWGSLGMQIGDPNGNRLRFDEKL